MEYFVVAGLIAILAAVVSIRWKIFSRRSAKTTFPNPIPTDAGFLVTIGQSLSSVGDTVVVIKWTLIQGYAMATCTLTTSDGTVVDYLPATLVDLSDGYYEWKIFRGKLPPGSYSAVATVQKTNEFGTVRLSAPYVGTLRDGIVVK